MSEHGVKIGILGAGQLGRMMALAGYPLGIPVRLFDTTPDAPAAQLGEFITGDYGDAALQRRFSAGLTAVTWEFEHLPLEAVQRIAEAVPVYPPPEALRVGQDRIAEKSFFGQLGIPVPRFTPVSSEAELLQGVQAIGTPAILKTTRAGYDGKGQARIRAAAEATEAFHSLPRVPLILEEFLDFEREISLIAVRSRAGEIRFYPAIENVHTGGILNSSHAPAPAAAPLQAEGEAYLHRILTALNYVGVLTVEFFVRDGHLVANEMAPRVHNSGHWTIEGAATSQFENHLRAVAGLPLGSTESRGCSIMYNIVGALPDTTGILAIPGAHLHLYGKSPRPGRKLGHVTITGDNPTTVQHLGEQLAPLLRNQFS